MKTKSLFIVCAGLFYLGLPTAQAATNAVPINELSLVQESGDAKVADLGAEVSPHHHHHHHHHFHHHGHHHHGHHHHGHHHHHHWNNSMNDKTDTAVPSPQVDKEG